MLMTLRRVQSYSERERVEERYDLRKWMLYHYELSKAKGRKEERLDVGGSMSHRQTQLGGIATIEDAFVQPSLSSMPQVSP